MFEQKGNWSLYKVSVFQNETKIFQVQIPDMLFPSPLVYSPVYDAIYIQNRAMTVSSYLQEILVLFFYFRGFSNVVLAALIVTTDNGTKWASMISLWFLLSFSHTVF